MVIGYSRVPEPPARMIPRIYYSSVDEIGVRQIGRGQRRRQIVVTEHRSHVIVHHAESRRDRLAGFAWATDLLLDHPDAIVDEDPAHFGVTRVGGSPFLQRGLALGGAARVADFDVIAG